MAKTKTKEEIYKDHYMKTLGSKKSVMVKAILPAMDEYAKQEAIEFAKWILDNAYSKDDYWYLHEYMSGDTHTTEELYSLYLQSKTK